MCDVLNDMDSGIMQGCTFCGSKYQN